MAKSDWGALQYQFLAERAKTGISPKEWCEAQGLNYTSARRYIKKPTIGQDRLPGWGQSSMTGLSRAKSITSIYSS